MSMAMPIVVSRRQDSGLRRQWLWVCGAQVLLEKTLIDQENRRLLLGIAGLKQQLRDNMVLSESTAWNHKANVLMQTYSCASLHR